MASSLAVETVYASLSTSIANSATDNLFDLMVNVINSAHNEINTKARTSLSLMGMGTTLVVVVVKEDKAYIAHVGDSRCYLFKSSLIKMDLGGFAVDVSNQIPPSPPLQSGELTSDKSNLKRLTNDHTMGDQLLANGIPKEKIPEKQFHTLTQAVGCGDFPIPDCSTVDLNQGDMLLLCSDGLTDMLTDAEIDTILSRDDANLDTLAENLIDAANAKGGRDNISVVLVKST